LDTQNTAQIKNTGIIQRQKTDDFTEEEEEEEEGIERKEGGIETEESSTRDFDEEASPIQRKPIMHHTAMSALEIEADRVADSIVHSQSVSVKPHPIAPLVAQPKRAPTKKSKHVPTKQSKHAPTKKPEDPIKCGRASTTHVKDYPHTYISHIDVDLTSQKITLTWSGRNAGSGSKGPFHSSPGAGICGKNCDNQATSTTPATDCTPKVTNTPVTGHTCRFKKYPEATYVTFFSRNGIALHYYPYVPHYPASHGCVRIKSEYVAQLIYDNTRIYKTTITVSGTWKRGKIKGKPVCWKVGE
jgi:hypothetical protein